VNVSRSLLVCTQLYGSQIHKNCSLNGSTIVNFASIALPVVEPDADVVDSVLLAADVGAEAAWLEVSG
jgi:hypothetical protein